MDCAATSVKNLELSGEEILLYNNICRVGHERVSSGYKPALHLKDLGLVTILEEHGGWTIRPTSFSPGFLARDEAVRAGRAYFARANNTLGVEGADFHVVQREGERWHFEVERDPANN